MAVERVHLPLRRQCAALPELPVGHQDWLPARALRRSQHALGVRVVMATQVFERVVDENKLLHGYA